MKKIITKLPALLAILVATACSNGIKTYDGLYIVGTQGKEVTTTLTVDDVPSAIAVNVAASETVEQNTTVTLKAAPELVDAFNKEHHKNYELLPQEAYKLENAAQTIAQGKHISEMGTKLTIINRDAMKFGTTYVLPISIDDVKGTSMPVIEASRTIYVVVNQVIVTKAADLDAPWRFYYADFSNNTGRFDTHAMKSVTFEARVRFKKMNSSSVKWCYSVMGLEENLCLRTMDGNYSWATPTTWTRAMCFLMINGCTWLVFTMAKQAKSTSISMANCKPKQRIVAEQLIWPTLMDKTTSSISDNRPTTTDVWKDGLARRAFGLLPERLPNSRTMCAG